MVQQHRSKRFTSINFSALLLVLVGVAAIIGLLEFTGTTHIFHRPAKPTTASAYTKGESSKSSTSSSSSTTGNNSTVSPSNNQNDNGSVTTSSILINPTGNFVSNHRPNLGGSPAPSSESSVCNTTPGATCKITFTKDGVTKSLVAETTDSGGATYWEWKLQDLELTSGSWYIQAIASWKGQTKTVSDPMTLDVSQ